jgi:hypothetical protein
MLSVGKSSLAKKRLRQLLHACLCRHNAGSRKEFAGEEAIETTTWRNKQHLFPFCRKEFAGEEAIETTPRMTRLRGLSWRRKEFAGEEAIESGPGGLRQCDGAIKAVGKSSLAKKRLRQPREQGLTLTRFRRKEFAGEEAIETWPWAK